MVSMSLVSNDGTENLHFSMIPKVFVNFETRGMDMVVKGQASCGGAHDFNGVQVRVHGK